MDERQEIKSLKKALRALTFLNRNGESTVTEVAVGIGVPRTTSYRLLETLASEGYVEKQQHCDLYRLTSQVESLSAGFRDTDLVVEVAKPLVTRVGAAIGWPLAFATPRGKDMVVRIATDHDTSLAIDRYAIGFSTPTLFAPAGFCYLAFCDEETRKTIIETSSLLDPQPEVLRHGATYLEYLLEQVRLRGYSHVVYPEYREGGLAVPLVIGGRVVGGIVMRYIKMGLKVEQLDREYAPILKRLGEDIAAAYEARIRQRLLEADHISHELGLIGAPRSHGERLEPLAAH